MLLEVGADRLKDEPHSADLRRMLTEESLAVDVQKWRQWQRSVKRFENTKRSVAEL